MLNISLTNDEATALVNMIDLAVKAGGIRVAGAGLVIVQKLEQAAQAQGKAPPASSVDPDDDGE